MKYWCIWFWCYHVKYIQFLEQKYQWLKNQFPNMSENIPLCKIKVSKQIIGSQKLLRGGIKEVNLENQFI